MSRSKFFLGWLFYFMIPYCGGYFTFAGLSSILPRTVAMVGGAIVGVGLLGAAIYGTMRLRRRNGS